MSNDDTRMTPWPENEARAGSTWDELTQRGGAEFAALHRAQRLLQDRLAGAVLPPSVSTELTGQLVDICQTLAAYQVSERERQDGWRPDLPGRGMPLMPPYFVDDETETKLSGRVTFTRFYLGGNGAAHGGAHPLLFDDVLGRLMNYRQAAVARTASLTVHYRRVTPLDVELRFEASVDRVDGRKKWGSGRLLDASGAVLADVEALFLQLLPGQP